MALYLRFGFANIDFYSLTGMVAKKYKKISTNKKVSYAKRSRVSVRTCYRVLTGAEGVVDPVKIFLSYSLNTT